jgi:hypothetical protein
MADGKTEPGSLAHGLAGYEHVVAHVDGGHADEPVLFDGVGGVEQQVQEHLLQLLRRGGQHGDHGVERLDAAAVAE